MDFAAYDFGASGDNGKGDHSSQNQQHAMDGSVDFFSFADVPADYHGNDPTTMSMDYSQDLGSSFAMTQFGNHDAPQLQDNMMLQGHGHVGNSAQYDMSPAHTPLNRPHGMGSIFGEDEVLYEYWCTSSYSLCHPNRIFSVLCFPLRLGHHHRHINNITRLNRAFHHSHHQRCIHNKGWRTYYNRDWL